MGPYQEGGATPGRQEDTLCLLRKPISSFIQQRCIRSPLDAGSLGYAQGMSARVGRSETPPCISQAWHTLEGALVTGMGRDLQFGVMISRAILNHRARRAAQPSGSDRSPMPVTGGGSHLWAPASPVTGLFNDSIGRCV